MSLDPRDLSFGGTAYLYGFRSSTPPRLCIRGSVSDRGCTGVRSRWIRRFVLGPARPVVRRDRVPVRVPKFDASTSVHPRVAGGYGRGGFKVRPVPARPVVRRDRVPGKYRFRGSTPPRGPQVSGNALVRASCSSVSRGYQDPILCSRDRRPEGPSWSVPGRSTPTGPCDRAWSVGVAGRCRSRGFPWIL